jgi:hypothetical protein
VRLEPRTPAFSADQALARGLELRAAHVIRPVEHLALQVAHVDRVEIHDAEVPTPAAAR